MDRRYNSVLRFLLAFVILFVVGLIVVFVGAVLHSQNSLVIGITFLAAVLAVIRTVERAFPSIYTKSRPRPWWANRVIVLFCVGIVPAFSHRESLHYGSAWSWCPVLSSPYSCT